MCHRFSQPCRCLASPIYPMIQGRRQSEATPTELSSRFRVQSRDAGPEACSGNPVSDDSRRLRSGAGDASQELFAHGRSGHRYHLITSP